MVKLYYNGGIAPQSNLKTPGGVISGVVLEAAGIGGYIEVDEIVARELIRRYNIPGESHHPFTMNYNEAQRHKLQVDKILNPPSPESTIEQALKSLDRDTFLNILQSRGIDLYEQKPSDEKAAIEKAAVELEQEDSETKTKRGRPIKKETE